MTTKKGGRGNTPLVFTDLIEVDTLELKKLPAQADDSSGLWQWLRFLKTDDVKELDMLSAANPEIKKATLIIKELSADEEARLQAEWYEDAERRRITNINAARQEGKELGVKEGIEQGKFEIARRLLQRGMTIEEAAELTRLPQDAVRSLARSLP